MAQPQLPVEPLAPPRAAVRAALVGPWNSGEFAAALTQVQAAATWSEFAALEAAYQWLQDLQLDGASAAPDLIFVAQRLPGDVTQSEVDRLQRCAPLTRIVIVAGTWCEGELRTGSPLTGTIRLYWYQLSTWWQAAIRRFHAGACPLWSLPLDHPQAGRLSVDGNHLSENFRSSRCPTVAIAASDVAVFESLRSALAAYEIASYRHCGTTEAGDSATAGIWDGGQLSPREQQRLREFRKEVVGPLIALLDFPRVEHLKQARDAGASTVLAKPYIVEELVAELLKL